MGKASGLSMGHSTAYVTVGTTDGRQACEQASDGRVVEEKAPQAGYQSQSSSRMASSKEQAGR